MIWRRLKKATREQEEEFRERMSDEIFGLLILLLFGAL